MAMVHQDIDDACRIILTLDQQMLTGDIVVRAELRLAQDAAGTATVPTDATSTVTGAPAAVSIEHTFTREEAQAPLMLDVPCYGRWMIDVWLRREYGNPFADTVFHSSVDVVAKEYHIAPLIATMPVLLFSLLFFADHIPHPALVTLQRDGHYDWDALPPGLYALPAPHQHESSMTYGWLQYQTQWFEAIFAYVTHLIDIHPVSHFTFYLNDYQIGWFLPRLFWAHQERGVTCSLRLLPDGHFNAIRCPSVVYNLFMDDGSSFADAHARARSSYQEIKQNMLAGAQLDDWWLDHMSALIPAMLEIEDDVQWWVLDKRFGTEQTSEEMYALINNAPGINEIDVVTLLDEVRQNGMQDALKRLLHYDDSAITQIVREGKESVVFIDTSLTFNQREEVIERFGNLGEWVQATQHLLSPNARVLYKAHPDVRDSSTRLEEANDAFVGILDPRTPMELHLLLHPELKLIGFPSTVFFEELARDRILAVLGIRRDEADITSSWEWASSCAALTQMHLTFISRPCTWDADLPYIPAPYARDYLEQPFDHKHSWYLLEPTATSERQLGYLDINTGDVAYASQTQVQAYRERYSSVRTQICVTIPTLNPNARLVRLVNQLKYQGFNRIIVVNDGSSQDSQPIFDEVAAIDEVTVLTHEQNKGYGAALKTAATYVAQLMEQDLELIGLVQCDSDGQHEPYDVAYAADMLIEHHDSLCVGQRDFANKGVPLHRRWANRATSAAFKVLFSTKLADTQSGLRALPKALIFNLNNVNGDHMEFTTALLLYARRMNIDVVPFEMATRYDPQSASSSHYRTFMDSARIIATMARELLAGKRKHRQH